MNIVNKCKSCHMPPLTPDVVEKKLKEEMIFTNDSDVRRVAKLYKSSFDAVTSTTRTLSCWAWYSRVWRFCCARAWQQVLRSTLGHCRFAFLQFCACSSFFRPSHRHAMPEPVSTTWPPTAIPATEQQGICAVDLFLTHPCRWRDAAHFVRFLACSWFRLCPPSFLFRRMTTGQAKQRDHETHLAQLA